MWEMLFMIGAMFLILYLFMIRPQKRRFNEHRATIEALTPGTRVLLTSGIFCTLNHIGERHAIVELAPGTEVTILKANIARPVDADEEEFELTDEMSEEGLEPLPHEIDGLEPVVDDAGLDAESSETDLETSESQTFDPRRDNA